MAEYLDAATRKQKSTPFFFRSFEFRFYFPFPWEPFTWYFAQNIISVYTNSCPAQTRKGVLTFTCSASGNYLRCPPSTQAVLLSRRLKSSSCISAYFMINEVKVHVTCTGVIEHWRLPRGLGDHHGAHLGSRLEHGNRGHFQRLCK